MLIVSTIVATAASANHAIDPIAHGRYLVVLGGCNDCQTQGYAESNGITPQSQWLQGNALGYRGPWSTTYARNPRLRIASMSENQW